MPRSRVAESSRDMSRVAPTPSTSTPVSSRALTPPLHGPAPAKNTPSRAMRVGKRPLQGTRLLVRAATSRSRGESMIRQPTTPAALQPKPMHMVRACLPQALAF